jgi:hypothetical protein
VSSVRSSSLFSRLCTNRTPSTPESSIFLSTASCHASPPLPLVPRSAALHFVPRLFSCTAIVVPAGALACAAASRRSCHALLPTRSGESGPQVVRALPHPPRPPRHLQSRILSTTSGPLLFAPPSELYNSSTPFLEKKKTCYRFLWLDHDITVVAASLESFGSCCLGQPRRRRDEQPCRLGPSAQPPRHDHCSRWLVQARCVSFPGSLRRRHHER